MVNVQLGRPEPTLEIFIKMGDRICELNYRGTKCETGAKVGDQKCNFALLLLGERYTPVSLPFLNKS